MKIFTLTAINCILILLTVFIHKIIYRILLLDYESLVLYWGLFLLVFFPMSLVVNIIFNKK
ncbi:bacteriocin-like WGxF protein [Salsuginibacillus kocurii]|uniref:bacteriocin-like WGxF protein n=1 Tax=Salsuginibacillus kocurii TaxID=427078 RepID=UPI000A046460|nr:bacteriocin-like WGxF protein [Salsuginibacillus kocurii]